MLRRVVFLALINHIQVKPFQKGLNMKIIVAIFSLFLIAGFIIAIFERRRGKAFLAHDLRKASPEPPSTSQAIGTATNFHPRGDITNH